MPEIKWQAPEYEPRKRGISWYWMSVIVSVLIIAFAVYERNFLFAVFILIAELLVLTLGGRAPRMVDFTLSEKGLTIDGKKTYSYGEIESWSVSPHHEETDAWRDVALKLKARLRPVLKIKIPRETAEPVEKALSLKIKRADWEVSLADALEDFIGF